MKEGIQELTLSTLVTQLDVLCELLINFENLKVNGFDLIEGVKARDWKGSFEHLKVPIYTKLGKQF